MLIDVLGWAIIVIAALGAIPDALSLIISQVDARRPPPLGAHGRPRAADDGERSATARELRKSLMGAATGVAFLLIVSRNDAEKWLTGTGILVIAIWEIGSWRALTQTKAWREHSWLLLPAATSLAMLASGWKYAPWLLGVAIFVTAAPDLDAWLRSRISREPQDPTTDPRN